MDFCNYVTAQLMLPAGAFFTSILVGWVASRGLVYEEFTNYNTARGRQLFTYYIFCVRYVVPVCIFLILLHQFGLI
jgi:NSS family neurotransmitter:Na+ symporter